MKRIIKKIFYYIFFYSIGYFLFKHLNFEQLWKYCFAYCYGGIIFLGGMMLDEVER